MFIIAPLTCATRGAATSKSSTSCPDTCCIRISSCCASTEGLLDKASGPFGYVDTPHAEAVIGTRIHATGWALDASGIDRVELRIDKRTHVAHYGLARPDVAQV